VNPVSISIIVGPSPFLAKISHTKMSDMDFSGSMTYPRELD